MKISETREQAQNHCKYKNREALLPSVPLGVLVIRDSKTKNLIDKMIRGGTKGKEKEQ